MNWGKCFTSDKMFCEVFKSLDFQSPQSRTKLESYNMLILKIHIISQQIKDKLSYTKEWGTKAI